MGKREADMFAAQLEGVDLDAPRAKRHKTVASSPVAIKEEAGTTSVGSSAKAEPGVASEDPEVVKERGLKVWQVIKDAVNKENRLLATDFIRLPSKRIYPDYYKIIKRPIALEDIKRKLEGGNYATFEEAKLDFELVFKNAKRFNIKDSQIWKDAKHLHKLVIKESNKLTGANEVPEGDDMDGPGADAPGSDGEASADKKKKPPNMIRLLKSRLQKLVDKSDDEGRVLSAEFMELPSKKQWPDYYRQIKHPQCFESIFKHLKRKEYNTVLEFANDVELVFSNALQFNMEHTPIWEDTIVLRDYFRQLMSDLPPPYSIPAYASPDHSTKIKLKMPSHASAVPSSSTTLAAPQNATAAAASPRLRIPPLAATSTSSNTVAPPQAATSAQVAPVPSTTTPSSALPPAVQAAIAAQSSTAYPAFPVSVAHASGVASQLTPYTQQPFAYVQPKQHYPTSSYQAAAIASTTSPTLPNTNNIHVNPPRAAKTQHAPPPQAPPVPAVPRTPQPPPVKIPNQIPPSLIAAKSPTPVSLQNRRQLRFVSVTTQPFGRQIDLDHRDGVKTWSVRLGPGEVSVRVGDVRFLASHHGDDGESSDDEDHKDKDKEKDEKDKTDDAEKPATADTEQQSQQREEEEEEADEPPPQPVKRGRGRPRKKPRGGKPVVEASPRDNEKAKAAHGPVVEEEVQLKCNGSVITPSEDAKETWEVTLTLGLNIVEIGEKGGNVWRMYLERIVGA